MFQFQPKQFYLIHLTWVHMLLLLLQHQHVADAQSTMEPVPTYMSHHNWEPSFAITVGAIIFALLFLGIISIYIRNCVGSRIIITQSNPTCSCSQGINKELLNTFPVLLYSTIKHLKIGKGALECAVCLIDFKDNDTLRLLPKCNHVFHPQCIDSWLASHVTCPVCRANLYQDSCQVSITVTTLLSTDQMGVESPETHDAEENQTDPNPNSNSNPDLHNLNEGEGNGDGGVASKLKLLRSNSTGHSLVEEGKCMDRYTLTLPEDVRRNILVNNGGWRSASYHNNNNNVVKGLFWNDNEGSSRGKRNNGEGRVERWVLCTPPFVARRG